jgi:hypothetical protein
MLREPASQIRSLFRYFQTNWNWIPPNMSFSEFVAASRSGTLTFGGNELLQNALRNVAYVDFLLEWRNACGADRIHVFLFEEAFSDGRRFMRHLAERFGIDAGFYDSYKFPRENPTYSVRSRVLQKFNVSVRSLLPQGALYRATRFLYRTVNTRIEGAERLDSELAITLADGYRQSNKQLADEFRLNLDPWIAVQESRLAKARM